MTWRVYRSKLARGAASDEHPGAKLPAGLSDTLYAYPKTSPGIREPRHCSWDQHAAE
jgi:hypothetical protein